MDTGWFSHVHEYCQSTTLLGHFAYSGVKSKQKKRIIWEKPPLGKYLMSFMGQWRSLLAHWSETNLSLRLPKLVWQRVTVQELRAKQWDSR